MEEEFGLDDVSDQTHSSMWTGIGDDRDICEDVALDFEREECNQRSVR